ncbi:hypothetical protein [Streptomyces poonensis]|uniref:Caspase domain-containing protein n=1 Tax=Streptomyces poonensis TaxID=68255 RepID=A0A918Q1A9_9ACTN|nr:hypothetical protein [Streptomyces poonensis]GGZ29007.1 hypothetical protein GCM10010365_56550 [Streptomyces poonensis]
MASRALVVGVGTYDVDSGIHGYPTIEASARAYGEALARDPRWGTAARSPVLDPHQARTADGVMRALHEAAAAGERPEDTLLVVYVGHGAYWQDVPGGQVHFAVGSSRINEPWTWLSAWYVYRAIRKSKAGLKVLIADCCYSSMLPHLGPEPVLPGVLGTRFRGTCVFTAVGGAVHNAWAGACANLPAPLDGCTTFSGHLLNVLGQGMPHHPDDLTLGALRAGIEEGMQECGVHDRPRMLLNDASEAALLFTNRAKGRSRMRTPGTVDEWVRELLLNGERKLPALMNRPDLAGRVVVQLKRGDEQSRDLARRVDRTAGELLTNPVDFVRYWGEIERAMLGGG